MYNVVPFGFTNAPIFYTAIMQDLCKEWFLLFADTKHLIHITSTSITIICNDKIVIDDILLYFNHFLALLH